MEMENVSDGCTKVWTTDESNSTVYAVDSVSAVANCRVCGGNSVVCGPAKEGFLFKSVRSPLNTQEGGRAIDFEISFSACT
jgi:hypothetical protein